MGEFYLRAGALRWCLRLLSKLIGLSMPILQRIATPRNTCRRIVAPQGAGSSPVGHPPIISKNTKPGARAMPP